ncbi:MAG: 3-deoxy-D-manno-octulosonic acid transferase [Desulfoprunum sp.]|nr:3-deoxy-D-manno-octulosonic acid transferase [Desulfoprunum sp.]
MIAFYNFCQLLLLVLTWPALILLIVLNPKYRKGIPNRLGFGLRQQLRPVLSTHKTVWIHALSVGEVSSAYPLVAGLRKEFPHLRIIFTVSTRTGLQVATTLLGPLVEKVIPSPLDLRLTVCHYIQVIQPDLFILVETDFWPNLLQTLKRKKVPTILVNGRISQKSASSYQKFAFFFRPLFQSFSHLCMQTDNDKRTMTQFGVKPESLHCLGNLKYDTSLQTSQRNLQELSQRIPPNSRVFLAGSTHKGEEDIILSVYAALKKMYSNLFLIIAPRNTKRRAEIGQLAAATDLSWQYRSEPQTGYADLLILDTMGELPGLYSLADVAFVGGSLVCQGGHNPIEAASGGIPVVFGPHMDDFAEIRLDLLQAGGAIEVVDQTSLKQALIMLFSSEEQRRKIGDLARAYIDIQGGVVNRHLAIIRKYL